MRPWSSRCAGAPILIWYVDACSAAWGARDCAEALAWLHHVFMELRLRAIAKCRGVMVARRPRANNKTLANIEAALKRARCERRCSFRRRAKNILHECAGQAFALLPGFFHMMCRFRMLLRVCPTSKTSITWHPIVDYVVLAPHICSSPRFDAYLSQHALRCILH